MKENNIKSTLELKSLEFFKEESRKALIEPFQSLAKFVVFASLVALFFEYRLFHNLNYITILSRVASVSISIILLLISYTNFGKKHPAVLIHLLLFSIVVSFGVMIYFFPKTIVFNSQIISLIIFIAALFLSWEFSNQIIVAIYYNIVFAISIFVSSKQIFLLPNLIESVILVLIISVMAIVANYINNELRKDAIIKNFQVAVSEKKYRSLVENSAEGIFQFTPDGKLITANPSLLKLLGFQFEDDIKKFSVPDDIFKRKSDWELLIKLLEKQGRVRNYRVPFKKKDGTEITVRMNVRKNEDDENYPLLYEGSLQDISQQVLAEIEKQKALDALRLEKMKADSAAKKAQQESQFKSKFLANMSHEVRTPMNSVMGFLTLIENDLFESIDELKSFAKDARVAAESLLGIINNILDLSKVEAGKMELDIVEFNVRDEIAKVITIMNQQAKSKGLQIEEYIHPLIPQSVYGDPTRFRQIIINLLGNAIKFTEQGKVGIEVILKSRNENIIELQTTVYDTGPGIPSDKLNMLFEPFSQIKGKKSAKEGSGLGLMIAKEFVKLMNGEINVESKVGIGSKFIFTVKLPLVNEIQQVKKEADSEIVQINDSVNNFSEEVKERSDRKKLLLVEDNPISRNLESKILKEVGYDIDAVATGFEAIDSVKTGKYNLVLMDVEMSGMDGLEATKKIRQLEEPFCKIPIIAVTAHSSMKDRERCLAAGMDDYISKPINIHFLKITIDQWLNVKR
ncbi:MAG: ATP-binding protein [Melioribacteraceae bacterium]|nr:ATP-binding protein [Melioribacteraceae bacterium]